MGLMTRTGAGAGHDLHPTTTIYSGEVALGGGSSGSASMVGRRSET